MKKMKKLLIMMALLPIGAWADEVNDTTFQYKDKQIVVTDDTLGVKIAVYDQKNGRLTKTREASFIEGQEVERVFVGSPFIPREELQDMDFAPHFPTVWFGSSYLTQGVFSNRSTDIHGRRSKGFSVGVTTYSFAQSFNKANSVGLTAAVQIAYARYCFQKDWQLQNGKPMAFVPTAERAKGHYIDVGRMMMPVMLQMSTDRYDGVAIGLAPEWRISNRYVWNPQKGSSMEKTADSYDIKPFGLNLLLTMGYGPVSMQAEVGLTPLFKTADGHKAYEASATIGVDVWTLTRMLRHNKR